MPRTYASGIVSADADGQELQRSARVATNGHCTCHQRWRPARRPARFVGSLRDQSQVTEVLLSIDDEPRSMSYAITEPGTLSGPQLSSDRPGPTNQQHG
jgi:hypothetical protein